MQLVLYRPDGRVADMVALRKIDAGRSWSRYPVHGGVWTAAGILTPGRVNELASDNIGGQEEDEKRTPAIASAVSVTAGGSPLQHLLLVGGVVAFATLLLLRIWRKHRPAP
jgi:hypothetical protein